MRLIGCHGHQTDTVTIAALRKLIPKLGQLLKVGAPDLGRVDEMTVGRGFQRCKLRPLPKRKVQLIRIPDLKDHDLMVGMTKMRQRFHQLIDIPKQIGNNDQQTATMDLDDHFVEYFAQFRFKLGASAL